MSSPPRKPIHVRESQRVSAYNGFSLHCDPMEVRSSSWKENKQEREYTIILMVTYSQYKLFTVAGSLLLQLVAELGEGSLGPPLFPLFF